MSANSFTEPDKRTTLVIPTLVGGAVAGMLDQIATFVSIGFNVSQRTSMCVDSGLKAA
jgi:hypothetical protein